MDLFQFIFMVLIIVTAGGWCLDWVFSGTVNPIYVEYTPQELARHEYTTIQCHVCSEQVRYSLQVMKTSGEVKCGRCGSFLTEEE